MVFSVHLILGLMSRSFYSRLDGSPPKTSRCIIPPCVHKHLRSSTRCNQFLIPILLESDRLEQIVCSIELDRQLMFIVLATHRGQVTGLTTSLKVANNHLVVMQGRSHGTTARGFALLGGFWQLVVRGSSSTALVHEQKESVLTPRRMIYGTATLRLDTATVGWLSGCTFFVFVAR